ncbi:MAG: DPP IV N-terminal domain-containing protein [Candidatus Poribacteria bacterium]|nr:DPP IV N-terminal domain-containing protein [Candidatus Poribacteria bacterium]
MTKRRGWLACAVGCVIAWMSALTAATAVTNQHAAWSPDGSKLVFVSDRSGQTDVYTMNADGSDLRRVTSTPATEETPSWSPDGTRLVYVANGEVTTADADGNDTRRWTDGGYENFAPVWSPTDNRIAFASTRNSNTDVYLVETATGELSRLTQHAAPDYNPAWSADGERLAFVSARDGNYEIYAMRPDGSGKKNLSRHPDGDYGPVWSPTNDAIAFVTDRNGAREIVVMNTDGGDPTPLIRRPAFEEWALRRLRLLRDHHQPANRESIRATPNPLMSFATDRRGNASFYSVNERAFVPITNAEPPSWLGENERIAVVPVETDWDIYLINADGSMPRRFVARWDDMPAWSHDGEQIVFMSGREDGKGNLYAARVDGDGASNAARLLAGDFADPDQSESPNRVSSISASMVYDRAGNLLHRIIGTPTVYVAPQWSPDGSRIVVTSDRDHKGSLHLIVIDLATGTLHNLTNGESAK